MSVTAHVVHATTRRARLRLPSMKGDTRFFARLKEELSHLAPVRDVHVNALTGSVLVRHSGDFDAVARHAHEHDLFDVQETPHETEAATEAPTSASTARTTERVRELLVHADETLRRQTKGTVDLRIITFAALVGGSAYQLVRGNFLPAGGTMLAQAMSLLFGRVLPGEE